MISCSLLGFVVPVILLIFTTCGLMQALRMSESMQKQHRQVFTFRKMPKVNVTQTLITIVIVFIVLILPSEFLQIWFFFSTGAKSELISLVVALCNMLHTANFANNFILYTIVNKQFRKTFREFIQCSWKTARVVRQERLHSMTSFTNVDLNQRNSLRSNMEFEEQE